MCIRDSLGADWSGCDVGFAGRDEILRRRRSILVCGMGLLMANQLFMPCPGCHRHVLHGHSCPFCHAAVPLSGGVIPFEQGSIAAYAAPPGLLEEPPSMPPSPPVVPARLGPMGLPVWVWFSLGGAFLVAALGTGIYLYNGRVATPNRRSRRRSKRGHGKRSGRHEKHNPCRAYSVQMIEAGPPLTIKQAAAIERVINPRCKTAPFLRPMGSERLIRIPPSRLRR